MIRQLSGTVIDVLEAAIVVDTGGVGYLVAVPQPTGYTLEQKVALYTHLAVRETAQDLYGFPTRDELDLFELLLTLPKIGPKSGLQIMTVADMTLIKQAVAEQDPAHLSKLSGLGKKTAEKVVAGLHEKLDLTGIASAGEILTESSLQRDTIEALITLGYPEADARKAVQFPAEELQAVTSTSEMVRLALQRLQ